MTATEFLGLIAALSGVLFVVTSMLSMGMNLTIPQITQPLKNVRLVLLALLANFVLVPLLAYIILLIIPLEESLQIGLIVLATAAGAPFLPKLVEVAKGDIAFGVGLMVLLMVVTIVYMPIVLPLLLPDVQVNPWDIAQSLIVLMLIPIGIGLFIRSSAPDTAARYEPLMSKTSSLAIVVLMVVGLGMNISNILDLIGTGGIVALLLFVIGCLAIGLVLGGRNSAVRSVMGLGTAQRNVAAAIVVSAQNFSGTNTLTFILVAAIVLLLILMPAARLMGGPATPETEQTEPS